MVVVVPLLPDDGVIPVTYGVGAFIILTDFEPEVPPPGVGLNTVTVADPADLMSVVGILAVS
jgi:hypothetical protein